MSEQWMSIVEYARKYNVSDMTVRRRIRTGKLEAELREGKYYIPIHSVRENPEPASRESADSYHVKTSEANNTGNDSREQMPPSMDGARVLRYFEESLEHLKASETMLKTSYENKIRLLEEKVRGKDLEIRELKQEIEDMQILLSLVDQKLQPK